MENSGKLAEFFARNLFRAKGYKVVAANYVTGRGTGAGEVDFIAVKKNLIVFVEVKKRKTLEDAAHAILPAQQKRIWNGAVAFLQKNPNYQNFDTRFDVVLVSSPLKYYHLEDAWRF